MSAPVPLHIICGPTAGCGRSVPMERVQASYAREGASMWVPPERCPHCNSYLGTFTTIRPEGAIVVIGVADTGEVI